MASPFSAPETRLPQLEDPGDLRTEDELYQWMSKVREILDVRLHGSRGSPLDKIATVSDVMQTGEVGIIDRGAVVLQPENRADWRLIHSGKQPIVTYPPDDAGSVAGHNYFYNFADSDGERLTVFASGLYGHDTGSPAGLLRKSFSVSLYRWNGTSWVSWGAAGGATAYEWGDSGASGSLMDGSEYCPFFLHETINGLDPGRYQIVLDLFTGLHPCKWKDVVLMAY